VTSSTNTIEVKVERAISAPPDEVFDAWLNPAIPGNPWNAAEKFILDPKETGSFTGISAGCRITADSLKCSGHFGSSIRGCQRTLSERNRW
jgi:hypothetical protein